MARKLRVQYPGAIYHVMNRGDHLEVIFRDERDPELFMCTLEEGCLKADWQVHSFCLMSNHFHLVIETPRANLAEGMKWLLGTYTSRFNRKHKLFGHLFSGRYKAKPVDGSGTGYLKSACDYVHLNPVRAGLLSPEQPLQSYRWSSYPLYLLAPEGRPPWLGTDRLLGEWGIPMDTVAGRQQFALHMEARRRAERTGDFSALPRGWCVGSEEFRQELLLQMTRVGGSKIRRTRMEGDQSAQGPVHPGRGVGPAKLDLRGSGATSQSRPGQACNRPAATGANHCDLQVDSPAPEHGRPRLPFKLPENCQRLNMQICATDLFTVLIILISVDDELWFHFSTRILIRNGDLFHPFSEAILDSSVMRARLWDDLLLNLAPYRPNRLEPRKLKRRPKKFGWLTKPRRTFKEYLHRNRYWKSNPRNLRALN